MRKLATTILAASLLTATALKAPASAATVDLNLFGPGVSAIMHLTYGPATDATYPNAYKVTGISGFFSDSNNGLNIVNAAIGALLPVKQDMPEPGNTLAPKDFSRFGPIAGLPPDNNGFLTYDNLYWPGGAPATAFDYQAAGGVLDIYGLMFSIGNGRYVDTWSNGTFVPGTPFDYGIAVANQDLRLDYVGSDVFVPEPTSLSLLGLGLLGLIARRRSN